MSKLLAKNIVLIPFAVDPLDQLGSLARQFLFDDRPRSAITFPPTHPNATTKAREDMRLASPNRHHLTCMCALEPLATTSVLWQFLHSTDTTGAHNPANGTWNHQGIRAPPPPGLIPHGRQTANQRESYYHSRMIHSYNGPCRPDLGQTGLITSAIILWRERVIYT